MYYLISKVIFGEGCHLNPSLLCLKTWIIKVIVSWLNLGIVASICWKKEDFKVMYVFIMVFVLRFKIFDGKEPNR